jgi:hypothetical protein
MYVLLQTRTYTVKSKQQIAVADALNFENRQTFRNIEAVRLHINLMKQHVARFDTAAKQNSVSVVEDKWGGKFDIHLYVDGIANYTYYQCKP